MLKTVKAMKSARYEKEVLQLRNRTEEVQKEYEESRKHPGVYRYSQTSKKECWTCCKNDKEHPGCKV